MQSARHEIPDEHLTDIQQFAMEATSEESPQSNQRLPELPVLSDMEDLDDPESIKRIGHWGEEYVYMVLSRRRCLPSGRKIASIDWVNETSESGKPYDIEVTLEKEETRGEEESNDEEDGTKVFIEVKSTASSSKDLVAFSWNELKFAEQESGSYHLYRVYHAGMKTPRLCQLENLTHYLKDRGVRMVFLL